MDKVIVSMYSVTTSTVCSNASILVLVNVVLEREGSGHLPVNGMEEPHEVFISWSWSGAKLS